MARFLSPEWFEAVAAASPAGADRPAELVLEQVVESTPDGRVAYRVEAAGGWARIVWPVPGSSPAPDLRITSDWPTAVAIARGELSTQNALMQGRLRVSGNPQQLAGPAASLEGADPVPAEVRQQTTYETAG